MCKKLLGIIPSAAARDGIVLSDGCACTESFIEKILRGAIDVGQFQIVIGCFVIRASDVVMRVIAIEVM
jgi:hypothetical protein